MTIKDIWNKWIKEQKPKTTKTWSEFVKSKELLGYKIDVVNNQGQHVYINTSSIEKSVLAHLKIYQLIEVGYGGNVTNEEWLDNEIEKFIITLNIPNCRYQFTIVKHVAPEYFNYIAFHTKEQAEEFLKYTENVQLLKDYFMI